MFAILRLLDRQPKDPQNVFPRENLSHVFTRSIASFAVAAMALGDEALVDRYRRVLYEDDARRRRGPIPRRMRHPPDGVRRHRRPSPPVSGGRGVTVAAEHRCSPYRSDEYAYPQAVEDDIIGRLGGSGAKRSI